MDFTPSRKKHDRKLLSRSKKRRCTTVNSHVNSSKSNNLNTSNSDNVIGTSKLPHIKVQNYSQFDTLITLQKVTDKESSVSINNKINDEKIYVKKFHLIKIQQK